VKYLKKFSIFEAKANPAPFLSSKEKLVLGRIVTGSYSQDPSTKEVNVQGDVDMSEGYGKAASKMTRSRWFKDIPFQFGEVTGNFDVSNQDIISLEGSPYKVGGTYYCQSASLRDIKGAPQEIGEDFNCGGNQIRSLRGGPVKVGGNYNCPSNGLTSLVGAPEEIFGNFNCGYNSVKVLTGAPTIVHGNFDYSFNPLKTLQGAPRKVGGDFIFAYDDMIEHYRRRSLSSLEGAPDEIGGWFIYLDTLKIRWNLAGWIEGYKKHPDLFGPWIPSQLDSIENFEGISHSDAALIRTQFPEIFQKMTANIDPEAVVALADLGDLGF